MPIGAPRSTRICRSPSARAFWRPYSLRGQVGASSGTSGVSPSKTWLVERNSVKMPRAFKTSITPRVRSTLTRAEPTGSAAQAAWFIARALASFCPSIATRKPVRGPCPSW